MSRRGGDLLGRDPLGGDRLLVAIERNEHDLAWTPAWASRVRR